MSPSAAQPRSRPEAAKNYDQRARKLGHNNVVDRFDNDATFALRMVEQGHQRDSLFQVSLYRFCVLPEFPRTYDQRLLGVGPGYGAKGHRYVRTVYVSGGNIEDYDANLRQLTEKCSAFHSSSRRWNEEHRHLWRAVSDAPGNRSREPRSRDS